MNLAIDTDRIRLNADVRDRLAELCTRDGAHLIYQSKKWFQVEVRGQQKKALVSPLRIAWALAHPMEHIGCTEEITNTCDHPASKHGNATGCCLEPTHLMKIPMRTVAQRNGPRKAVAA